MKKIFLPLLIALFLISCIKEDPSRTSTKTSVLNERNESILAKSYNSSILICHQNGNGSWQLKTISVNAWPMHEAHGDVRLDDQDGDGYVPNNSCGYGNQGDCNDTNAFIHPGVAEICNGIDDNCNGIIDESCYPAVIIGKQVWMSKNLDVTTYRNGDPIPEVQSGSAWSALTTGAWCNYDNNPGNGAIYGRLYNHYTIRDPRGLAPIGWHIATLAEWDSLARFLDPNAVINPPGGPISLIAGGALKETGLSHWVSPNTGATNSTGFTALPAGWRDDEGVFSLLGTHAIWWSHLETSPFATVGRLLMYNTAALYPGGNQAAYGIPIRCVRD